MGILAIIILLWFLLGFYSWHRRIEARKKFEKLSFHEQKRMKVKAWKKFIWWGIILFIFALIFRDI